MLLDLTVRPVQILPDECPQSLIIRTLGTGTYVTGIIGIREDGHGYRKREKDPIQPAAELVRKDKTMRETRLPLEQRQPRKYHPQNSILGEPFEVSSAYKDVATSKMEVADYLIFLEHRKTRCLVTVQSEGKMLLTIVVKDYDQPSLDEPVPLQRFKKAHQGQALSAWERMVEEDD